MKQSVAIVTAFLLGGATFAWSYGSKATSVAEAKTIVAEAEQQKGEHVEGFLIEKPKFDVSTKTWQLKISVRKNTKLENTAIVVSLPMSRSAQITRYYQGDYVKLNNVALGDSSQKDDTQDDASKDLASETQSSISSVQ